MQERKEYNTKNKKYITSYLMNQKQRTVSAKELYNHLKEKDIAINLSTVYRNLETLSEDGLVQKFQGSDGKTAAFKYMEKSCGCHHHFHIQCTKCGILLHLDCEFMNEYMNKFIGHLAVHHNFALELNSSMLYGLCDTCKAED